MPDRGELNLDVSAEFAELMEQMTGHRPENARLFINEEIATLVVAGSLTEHERRLAAIDPEDARNERRRIQGALCARLAEIVETASGRKVTACIGDHAIDPDCGIYNLILGGPADD
jgi:hypothetical protein